MEHNQDPKVTVDRRATPHLPGPLVLNKCARIEDVSCVGQSYRINPCGVDDVDWKSSQTLSPYIVRVGFDGVRNTCEKIRPEQFSTAGLARHLIQVLASLEGDENCIAQRPEYHSPPKVPPGHLLVGCYQSSFLIVL